jgi:hypothetical protein
VLQHVFSSAGRRFSSCHKLHTVALLCIVRVDTSTPLPSVLQPRWHDVTCSSRACWHYPIKETPCKSQTMQAVITVSLSAQSNSIRCDCKSTHSRQSCCIANTNMLHTNASVI